jgi:hypothetical protein
LRCGQRPVPPPWSISSRLAALDIATSFACAYPIPSEHHVAVPADEQIVFDQIPDEWPCGPRADQRHTTRIVKPNKRESE